jgi:hypothetical protein
MKGFVDNNMVLSDNQTLYSATGLTNSESTNALRLPESRLGDGHPLYLNVMISTACAARTSAGNLQVTLQDAADSSGAHGTFADTSIETQTVTITNLTAGYEVLRVALPSDTRAWIQLEYDALTMSAGGIDAWISDH